VQSVETPSSVAVTTKGLGKAQQAFQRGVAALTQRVEREGAGRPVPCGHTEEITVDGETEPVIVKLGALGIEHSREAAGAHPGTTGRPAGPGRAVGVIKHVGCNGLGGTEGGAGTNVLGWAGRGWD
jgi:hypothetical protein